MRIQKIHFILTYRNENSHLVERRRIEDKKEGDGVLEK